MSWLTNCRDNHPRMPLPSPPWGAIAPPPAPVATARVVNPTALLLPISRGLSQTAPLEVNASLAGTPAARLGRSVRPLTDARHVVLVVPLPVKQCCMLPRA